MPGVTLQQVLDHIALTIEGATGSRPEGIESLAPIWEQASADPEFLADPRQRSVFVQSINAAVPTVQLASDFAWNSFVRQTPAVAARFAEDAMDVPGEKLGQNLHQWLVQTLGEDRRHLLAQPELDRFVKSGKFEDLRALRMQVIAMDGPDLLDCPYLPEMWRIRLRQEINRAHEEDLRLLAQAEELRTLPRIAIVRYGEQLFRHQPSLGEGENNVVSIAQHRAAQALSAARSLAEQDVESRIPQLPPALLDTVAIAAYYLDVLRRGQFADAAAVLDAFPLEQMRLGIFLVQESDADFQTMGEFRVLMPFDFNYVGVDGRERLRQRLEARDIPEAERQAKISSFISEGLSELGIEAWYAFAQLRERRERLNTLTWAESHFDGDDFKFLERFFRIHDLAHSFHELEYEIQYAAQEWWNTQPDATTWGVDWIQVFFFEYYYFELSWDAERANHFLEQVTSLYPNEGLQRFARVNEVTQDFLDERFGQVWREWLPISPIPHKLVVGERSALSSLGEAIFAAPPSDAGAGRFLASFLQKIRHDPQMQVFSDLPDSIFSLVAEGEYYFYLLAHEQFEQAAKVQEHVGDEVLYFASALRFRTFPRHVTLQNGQHLLVPQTALGQLLIAIPDDQLTPRLAGAQLNDPLQRYGQRFYYELLNAQTLDQIAAVLFHNVIVDGKGRAFLCNYVEGQHDAVVQFALYTDAALEENGASLANAVQAFLRANPDKRATWQQMAAILDPDLIPGLLSDDAGLEAHADGEPESEPEPASGAGQTFQPEIDEGVQALMGQLGRGTTSILPDETAFPLPQTTSEPLAEVWRSSELPGFADGPEHKDLPAREVIKEEDLPNLVIERGAVMPAQEALPASLNEERVHKLLQYYARQRNAAGNANLAASYPSVELSALNAAGATALAQLLAEAQLGEALAAFRILAFVH